MQLDTGQAMLKNDEDFFKNFEDYKFDLWKDSLNGNLSSTFSHDKGCFKINEKK